MDAHQPLPARVIAAFGGLTKTSKATGCPISTVDGWVRAGKFPGWRIRDIREAAERENVPLPEDFPTAEAAE